jgi:hypothetical protein
VRPLLKSGGNDPRVSIRIYAKSRSPGASRRGPRIISRGTHGRGEQLVRSLEILPASSFMKRTS